MAAPTAACCLTLLLVIGLSTARILQEPQPGTNNKNPTIAMCTVARDIQEDIEEHIAYHKFIGFTKYFLLDHCSEPLMYNNIEKYVKDGFVEYNYVCEDPAVKEQKKGQMQLDMFTRCLRAAAGKVDYVALFDADEYLVLNEHDNVSSLMASYGDIGALAVNWVVFGTSGHVVRPEGGVLANYNKCAYNKHVKLIVNTKYVLHQDFSVHGHNVHTLFFTNDKVVVNELGQPVAGYETAKHSSTKVALYHYYSRSLQDWLARARRGNFSLGKASQAHFTLTKLSELDATTNQTCTKGQELAKAMRRRLPEASTFGSA